MSRYLLEKGTTKTILTYENGKMTEIKSEPEIRGNHLVYFVNNSILDEENIKVLEEAGGTITKLDVQFEDFWRKYPMPVGKKRALLRWEKMKEDERQEAYKYLPKYIRQVELDRIAFMHPLTYLNSYRWEDGN